MYHPHTANTASMEENQRNIRLASSNDKHTVWIGGDFNLPEINWEDLVNIHVKENSKNADIHQEFIELTTNCGLNQLVNKPTRSDNTLDLFLTNKPSTIYRTEVCHGISDHDLVYIEATTKPVKIKTAPREAFLYKKKPTMTPSKGK